MATASKSSRPKGLSRDRTRPPTREHTAPSPGRTAASVTVPGLRSTDTGLRRAHNEDSLLAEPPMFAVADGMGGHAAGDVASAAVVDAAGRTSPAPTSSTPTRSSTALRAATADIAPRGRRGTPRRRHHRHRRRADDAGAAAAYWAVFNVGDCRVYMFEDGELVQVTVDHSVVQELVDAGAISRGGRRVAPATATSSRAPSASTRSRCPTTGCCRCAPGLRLLLCSDGLTKEVADDRDPGASRRPGQHAGETADALVAAALAAGGRDNVTVVIVDVLDVPPLTVRRRPSAP